MSEFDLIPSDYRLGLAVRHWLLRVCLATGVVASLLLAAAGTLAYANNDLTQQIRQLQTHHAMTTQQREQLEKLDSHIGDMRRQLHLLTTLRGGAPAEQVFHVINAALPQGSVWLQEWDFARAGTAEEIVASVNAGYFIIVDDNATEPAPEWKVQTHVTLHGQARDHAALSSFARQLYQQPAVSDVRVQQATLRRFTTANIVEFELTAVLGHGGEQ